MHNIKIEISNESIDNFIEDMNLARTYYNEQVKRKNQQATKSKNIRVAEKNRKQAASCLQKSALSPKRQKISSIEQKNKNIFLSTFVNINNARYQIGPIKQYNYQNLQFPSFGHRTHRSPKPQVNPEELALSWSIMNSSARSVERSNVKKSWDRYININYLNKSDKACDNFKLLRKTLYRHSKRDDKTQQNIEGWKQDFHQEDYMNP